MEASRRYSSSRSSASPAARHPRGKAPERKGNAPSRKAEKRPSPLGASVPRKDGLPKVDGSALYADDLVFPGMLHAAIATSEHPHA